MIKTEVDITEPIKIILNNKFKIILITVFFMFVGYFFHFKQTSMDNIDSTYNIETNISPITIFEEQTYEIYNNYLTKKALYITTPFKRITSEYLLELFISKLKSNKYEIFSNSIKKTKILDKENFDNDEHYNDAVENLIDSIEILKFKDTDLNNNDNLISYFSNKEPIIFSFNINSKNKKQINKFIYEVEKMTNLEVRKNIIKNFDTYLEIEKNMISNQKILAPAIIYEPEYRNFLQSLSTEVIKALKLEMDDLYRYYTDQTAEIFLSKKRETLNFIIDFFNASTIINNPKNFYAAKINKTKQLNIREITKSPKINTFQVLAISALGGLVFSAIFVLMFSLYSNKRV